MKKARSFYLLLVASLLSVFTACSERHSSYRIGVSQCSDDEWRTQMNKEMLREALFYEGVTVDIRTAYDDNQQQVEQIRQFINEKVDLLIVSPNESLPITPVVEEAFDAGIPVVVVDRKILSDKYTAYIGADNYEIGKAVGNYIVAQLQGRGTVIELTGLAGSSPAIDRHQGFRSVLMHHPNIQVLAQADAGWLRLNAEQQMDSLLKRFPLIDIVFAHNDRMAAGAYDAAYRSGRSEGIDFVGIDALSGEGLGVDQVLSKHLTATFIYPTGGDQVIQRSMDILNGRSFPRFTQLSTSLVDSTNAPIMRMQTNHISALDAKIYTLTGKMNQYLARYDTQQIILYGGLLVLLLLIGLLGVVYVALRSKNRLNGELSMQKQVLEQQHATLAAQKEELDRQKTHLERLYSELEEATHAKLVFFTNISHDFRTPLTLLADPIEQLMADTSLPEQHRYVLHLMQKNVQILLRLVSQILDFRKIENGRMELHSQPFDLLRCFSSWNDHFRMALRKKHLNFSFHATPNTDYLTMADAEKMERIYFNLLSNAIKYTPENGVIAVTLERISLAGTPSAKAHPSDSFRFSIFNSCSYISQKEVEAVFERFYQVDSHHAGTGIGLALVRAFVEMHGGNIAVTSDDRGTTFLIYLPICSTDEQEPQGEIPSPHTDATPLILLTDDLPTEEEGAPDRPTILIIDDNADIRGYVRHLLASSYRVIDAPDGAAGVRYAMKYVPDVIVCDVMMPGMDGIECCKRLKEEVCTCHIPIILLTACSLDEQRIQGYDGGADSYISKPFNSQLLLSRIQNLIGSRQKLRIALGDVTTACKASLCELDNDFVTRFRLLIDERLRDATLNVEDMGKALGMSRVQLYRKLKSLTNFSPNELLRQARLKKAMQLITSSEMTIAEIAYEVGFSSPSYFTKCYKEEFGEIPTELMRRKQGG